MSGPPAGGFTLDAIGAGSVTAVVGAGVGSGVPCGDPSVL